MSAVLAKPQVKDFLKTLAKGKEKGQEQRKEHNVNAHAVAEEGEPSKKPWEEDIRELSSPSYSPPTSFSYSSESSSSSNPRRRRVDECLGMVHGGSSGIGTFAIQIAKYIGAKVFCTAGDQAKLHQCQALGADVLINYKEEDFVKRVKEETGGQGVNVILDNMGALYLQRNLDALGMDGRLFIIGFQGGNSGELNLGPILAKRLTVQAAGLRSRSLEKKAQIVEEARTHVWPAIECGKVKPVIYKTFPLAQAADAQRLLETSKHVGKILLIP
ncbi:hypothetical protein L7F22_001751 [Adiantum nelumboides]|nr:hypothetical protein [Adiantum nelumboides]